MRTTVRLDDQLLEELKRYATERGTSLTAVFDEALREKLARRRANAQSAPVELPTFRGRGLQPGVDLYDGAALLDRMERDAGS